MESLYLRGHTIQEVGGKVMIGSSIYGVAVINGSSFYGIVIVVACLYVALP